MREYRQPKRSSWFLGPKYLQNTPMPYKPVFLKRNHFTRFFFCRFNLASVSRQSPGKRSFSDETWHLDFCVPSSPNSRALFFQTSREVALKLRPWVHIVIDMEIKESCVYLLLRTMATRSFEVQNTRRSRQLCSPSRELHEFLLGFFWLLTSFQKCPCIQWWPGDHFLKMEKPASSSRVCKFDQICLNSRIGQFPFQIAKSEGGECTVGHAFWGVLCTRFFLGGLHWRSRYNLLRTAKQLRSTLSSCKLCQMDPAAPLSLTR